MSINGGKIALSVKERAIRPLISDEELEARRAVSKVENRTAQRL